MNKIAITLLIFMLASPAKGFVHWNSIRHSALLPNGEVVVRLENASGPGIENYVLYSDSEVLEEVMNPVADGPATLEAFVPGPIAATRYYGFRLLQGSELDLMPVRIANGESPEPNDLTHLSSDPAGDHRFGYVNLDLVECRVSFSDTKLFAALKNSGGGFPTVQGLTFFGYLLAIANPALADPDTVFALMHTYNQPGIITPGLYKITGSGMSNLIKIGNIEIQIFASENTLLLSCNLSDLMADPYFQSWYDPSDPVIGAAAFTQRITLLSGAEESDRTPGGRVYLREYSISPGPNELPGLQGLSFEGTGSDAYARLDYFDPDDHCPVVAEIAFDGGTPYPMYPQSLSYESSVEYRTAAGIEPLANDSWSYAVARFSDNLADTIAVYATTTGVDDGDWERDLPIFRAAAFPNPFGSQVNVCIEAAKAERFRIEVFDARGALVRNIYSGTLDTGLSELIWDGRDYRGLRVPSGIYLCRIASGKQVVVRKIVLLR